MVRPNSVSEAAPAGAVPPAPGGRGDLSARIMALRARGADLADPVRFRFIEVLDRRAAACGGDVGRILQAKLAKALADYSEQHDRPACDAAGALDRARGAMVSADAPHRQAIALAGGTRRDAAAAAQSTGQRGPLADLVDLMARRSSETGQGGASGVAAVGQDASANSATLRYFRRTWSRLSVDHQLSQSLAKGPENAGPLNSHRLVLRSLECMRDLSPAYLDRFVSQVEALQWLDQAISSCANAPANATRGDGEKKRKTTRRKGH